MHQQPSREIKFIKPASLPAGLYCMVFVQVSSVHVSAIITVSVMCAYYHHAKTHRKSVFMPLFKSLFREHKSAFLCHMPCKISNLRFLSVISHRDL